jgi:hypothetical protein
MLMRLTSRLLQAILITAIVYVTMLLDQAEQPGLQQAEAAPPAQVNQTQMHQIQAHQIQANRI